MEETRSSEKEYILNVNEAAKILGVYPGTIRRYDKNGLIKSKRDFNNHRRFAMQDVLELKKKLHPSE